MWESRRVCNDRGFLGSRTWRKSLNSRSSAWLTGAKKVTLLRLTKSSRVCNKAAFSTSSV
jgi:hypothetical protein